MKYFIPFLLVIACSTNSINAQNVFTDTVSVFAYNILNYGIAATKSCPLEGSPLKNGYIATILKYENVPDIVSFEKFSATPTNLASDTMQTKIMDSVCAGCYANVAYTNVSGYSKVNTLFYNKNKFGYSGTTTIYSGDNSISDIDMHKLYYLKFPSKGDTIFLNVIVIHDASGASDSSQRGTELAGAMSWFKKNVTKSGNYIFMGDFNTQSASEPCIQDLINPKDTIVKFYEPTNQIGEWSYSPATYAKYLTQSTRTIDPGDCGATGGLGNWFDHIFCTNSIMNGLQNVKYIPSSFEVVGQDGLHTNIALTDAPTNTSVPPSVLNALYMNSEHLPVQLKLQISSAYPLPVGFDYFNIKLKDNQTYLQWQNNNNASANAYVIERSEDGIDFTIVSTVYALTSTNTYNYLDAALTNNNIVYYRIKEVLKTGDYLYSSVASVRLNNSINHITISPNPVQDKLLLSLQSNGATAANIHIVNILGQVCNTQKAQLQSGANTIKINNLSNLTKGIYIIKVQTGNATESKIFIKE
jgi:hypothetical protein